VEFSKSLLIVVCCIVIPVAGITVRAQNPPDAVTLNLDACIRRALEANIDLTASRQGLEAARSRLAQSRRALWPSLSAWMTDNTSLDATGQYSQYDPATGQSYVPGEGFQAGAEINYPIFDAGGARSRYRSESMALERDELDVRQTERDIVKQAFETYLAVLERTAELVVRNEQVAQAMEAVKISKNRLDQGSGIEYEVLLEEAYLAQSVADRVATEHALRQAERSLLLLLDMDPAMPVELVPLNPLDPVRMSQSDIVQTARENRLEFERYDAEINAQKMQLKILKASRKPRMDLFLSFNRQGSDIESFNEADSYWTAGISLRFSPFPDASVSGSTRREWIESTEFMQKSNLTVDINDGSSILDREIEQTVLIRRLEKERARLLHRIETEVMAAYENYRTDCEYLDARRKNLEAMTENYRIQTKSNELGH